MFDKELNRMFQNIRHTHLLFEGEIQQRNYIVYWAKQQGNLVS